MGAQETCTKRLICCFLSAAYRYWETSKDGRPLKFRGRRLESIVWIA